MRNLVLLALLTGCAPTMKALGGPSTTGPVTVAFCGSDHVIEKNVTEWTYTSDTGESQVCLLVTNRSRKPLRIDRQRIKLSAVGYRGGSTPDGQQRVWTIERGTEEPISVNYMTEELQRGATLTITFTGALTLDGEPIDIAPMRVAYK